MKSEALPNFQIFQISKFGTHEIKFLGDETRSYAKLGNDGMRLTGFIRSGSIPLLGLIHARNEVLRLRSVVPIGARYNFSPRCAQDDGTLKRRASARTRPRWRKGK